MLLLYGVIPFWILRLVRVLGPSPEEMFCHSVLERNACINFALSGRDVLLIIEDRCAQDMICSGYLTEAVWM